MTADLQAFSDSLIAARPQAIQADMLPRVAACLRASDIDAKGASLAARLAIANRLLSLPFLTAEAVARLDPAFKDLLLAYLANEPLLDGILEDLFTRLRRGILMDLLAGADPGAFGLDLIAALALFCFGTEYIFEESESETQRLPELERRATPVAAALLACYRPLSGYPALAPAWAAASGLFARLVAAQVHEPEEERAIAAAIPGLSSVTDPISRRVQAMYEENPYPRWRLLRPERGIVHAGTPRSILIAGCGSGRHALMWARAYPTARILAVDLSRASLAYAIRQARTLGIAAVEFRQGDILALAGSAERFDLVSCIGVIHHMARPQDGLNALAGVLQADGVLELGIYSRSGRREVVAAADLCRDLHLSATPDGIRALRRVIRTLPLDHPAAPAREDQDFYSMSGCRDYLFHIQEHRFTLPEVETLLANAELRLLEIDLAPGNHDGAPAGTADLGRWHTYETAHPGCFGSMYRMRLSRR